jgi:hypothetical protein
MQGRRSTGIPAPTARTETASQRLTELPLRHIQLDDPDFIPIYLPGGKITLGKIIRPEPEQTEDEWIDSLMKNDDLVGSKKSQVIRMLRNAGIRNPNDDEIRATLKQQYGQANIDRVNARDGIISGGGGGGGPVDPYVYPFIQTATSYRGPPVEGPPTRSALDAVRTTPAELREMVKKYMIDHGKRVRDEDVTEYMKKNPTFVKELRNKGLAAMGTPAWF